MISCNLCPRKCNANRKSGQNGFCGTTDKLLIARVAPHYWEEPPLSGKNGSGTIFFGGCNLKCVYCQNAKISRGNGKIYTPDELIDAIKNLESQKVHNINLVTPTHYTDIIADILSKYTPALPVIWNSSGYELPETLKMLEGKVQIYLPDFKYADNALAKQYSNADNYSEVALCAIKEMVRQVGRPTFTKKGIMKKGVIVRHLILPGHLQNSKDSLKLLFENFGNKIYYSVMSQYTPCHKNLPAPLNRTLSEAEYNEILNFADNLGITHGFSQEGGAAKESFIPDFEVE